MVVVFLPGCDNTRGMEWMAWGLAAVATLAAIVGWLRASREGARAAAAEQRAQVAEQRLAQLRAVDEPAASSAPASPRSPAAPSPAPAAVAAPASAPKRTPQIDPKVVARARKLLKQSRDMARFMDIDKRQEYAGQLGYRVPCELDDALDHEAFEYLRDADENFLLGVAHEGDSYYLLVR